MKITISRETLFDLISNVIGAVEKRNTSQILENILMRAEGDKLTLYGTDLEIELSAYTPLQAEVEGSITVPARKFLDICKALPADTLLSMEVNDKQRLIIQGIRSRFELSTLPADEFPVLDQIPMDQELQVSEKDLKTALDSTAFAMANQDVRYYLNGMLFDISDSALATVSTDGHRLALHKLTGIETSSDEGQQIILPRKGVLELSRLLDGTRELPITLQISNNHIRAQTDTVRFTSKLIDGRYPDYKGAIPVNFTTELTLDRMQFRDTLQRVSILSNEKFRGVKLTLKKDLMVIESNNPEQETATEEIDINYDGDDFEIGFNVTYLLEAINHLKGDVAMLSLNTPESSVITYDPEDDLTRYIVMPIKL